MKQGFVITKVSQLVRAYSWLGTQEIFTVGDLKEKTHKNTWNLTFEF